MNVHLNVEVRVITDVEVRVRVVRNVTDGVNVNMEDVKSNKYDSERRKSWDKCPLLSVYRRLGKCEWRTNNVNNILIERTTVQTINGTISAP